MWWRMVQGGLAPQQLPPGAERDVERILMPRLGLTRLTAA
jgi:hypothetical protein